ncbi:hypothetical protein COCSADRAFT_261431 [Bipolaris sorokiniana ND90Pr]|uniref:Uncharacterized protein n=1 Tax=Cochliobolus sativus (strain ND90Pr / ATCC 201652) TaxID=665912 RepID=M2RUT6_COCSN|nr:uncharacterized protein COCSADRAFT_261431 [Bipolaris sorokiniana ND90Pr]EMD58888.1 hypothetical protein COCSADRAFT_261431 [Bipolaris sorokiniana ND90Pr]
MRHEQFDNSGQWQARSHRLRLTYLHPDHLTMVYPHHGQALDPSTAVFVFVALFSSLPPSSSLLFGSSSLSSSSLSWLQDSAPA